MRWLSGVRWGFVSLTRPILSAFSISPPKLSRHSLDHYILHLITTNWKTACLLSRFGGQRHYYSQISGKYRMFNHLQFKYASQSEASELFVRSKLIFDSSLPIKLKSPFAKFHIFRDSEIPCLKCSASVPQLEPTKCTWRKSFSLSGISNSSDCCGRIETIKS